MADLPGRRLLWLWGPVLVYTGFIFWLSSAPRPIPGIERWPWLDKVCHTVEYAPLGSLLARAFRRSKERWVWSRVQAFSLLCAVAVGGMDEWYQRFIPLRVSSLWDLLWDGIGAALGQQIYRIRKGRLTPSR